MSHRELKRLHSPQNKRQTFGIIQRQIQPSMFDLLTWNTERVQNILPTKIVKQVQQEYYQYKNIYHPQYIHVKDQNIPEHTPQVEELVQVRSVPQVKFKEEKIKVEKPITKDLYEYEEVVPLNKKVKEVKNKNVKDVKPRPYSAAVNRKSEAKGPKRPPFAAYGSGNTTNIQTANMKSHNIVPHSPKYKLHQNDTNPMGASRQVFDSAEEMNQYYNKNKYHYEQSEQGKTRTILSAKVIEPTKNKQAKLKKKKVNQQQHDNDDSMQLLKNKNIKEKPLKFMNKRQDFILNQRQEEVKKNRLALKPTECYPGDYNVKAINLTQSHSNTALAAGKRNPQHQDIRNLMVDPQYSRA